MSEKEGALSKAWNRGLEDLRDANLGKFAMGAVPVVEAPAAEAPAAEPAPSYEASLNKAASVTESRSTDREGMSR